MSLNVKKTSGRAGEGSEDAKPQGQTTPFGALKEAPSFVQLAIDPSQELTRKRYAWRTNGTLFDETLFSDVEAGIRIQTRSTESGDEARLRAAFAGQYVSQALAVPGLGLVIDDSNVSLDGDNSASLSHGEVYAGAFYWDSGGSQVDTGIGWKWDSTQWEFFVKSLGSHLGNSPIPQDQWGFDSFNGSGPSDRIISPADGVVHNWPYSWYNESPLTGALLNPDADQVQRAVDLEVKGRPSTDTPNLVPQVVVRNAGTAQQLGVEVGGMQFTTYGANRQDLERRRTPETRITANGYISNQRATTDNAVDPASEPGKPLVAVQRESGFRDLPVRTTKVFGKASSDDVWVYIWDEYDPGTALSNENFDDPTTPNNPTRETHVKTDTVGDDYSPSTAVFRGMEYFASGQGNTVELTEEDIDERIPIDATRIYTAVNVGGSNAGLQPFKAQVEEAY